MTSSYVSPEYGWTTYMSLHSRFIDWLIRDLDDEHRAKVLAHFGGRIDMASFLMALHAWGWARVCTRISDDGQDAWIGIEIPVMQDLGDGRRIVEWQRAFELHHRILGLSPQVIVDLALHDLTAEVDALLDTPPQGSDPS